MKVALVQTPVWWTIDPPLGLAQMAGCALQYGHEPSVFDLNIELWKDRSPKYANMWLWEQFHFWNNPAVVKDFFEDNRERVDAYVEAILKTDARAVCFSIALGAQLTAAEIARRIKRADPKRTIVAGGQYFFRGMKSREMLDQGFDVIIQGTGDRAFIKLLADVERTGGPGTGPGLVFKRDGRVVDTGPAEPFRSLDAVPFADFTRFPMHLYEDRNRIPISASRGCVWACRFCSTREFWPMYSYMSGERIYAEVLHHRRLFPDRFHVEFYDITANGKPETLSRFSDLVIQNESRTGYKHFKWKINAIIRPEMTAELLGKMARANCQDIIYGIESGSPRVLKKMNKHYKVETAERVLRDTHGAGIKAVGNFMFGFPGETEEDFQLTLGFLRRNHASFDHVYASATFTSLEEHSFLTEHQEDFGITRSEKKEHNLYWQSKDGSNNYLVRLDRYKRFRELAISLGVDAYKGVNGNLDQDHVLNTAQYYLHSDQPYSALKNYLRYMEDDPTNAGVWNQLDGYLSNLRRIEGAMSLLSQAEEKLVALPAARRKKALAAVAAFVSAKKPPKRAPSSKGPAGLVAAALGRLKKLTRYSASVSVDGRGRFSVRWAKDRLPALSDYHQMLEAFSRRERTFRRGAVDGSPKAAA